MNNNLDFDFNEELEEPVTSTSSKPTSTTQPKKSNQKGRESMNQTNYTLTEKQFKVLQFITKECYRYLDLEETAPTAKRRGAANQPEKSEMDEVFEQLMKVSNTLREDYINNLMK